MTLAPVSRSDATDTDRNLRIAARWIQLSGVERAIAEAERDRRAR